jgi:hypothetical protein
MKKLAIILVVTGLTLWALGVVAGSRDIRCAEFGERTACSARLPDLGRYALGLPFKVEFFPP